MTLLAAGGGGGNTAGVIAFLVVLGLCLAAFFLFRSMNRHLRKVPASFDPPPPAAEPDPPPHDPDPDRP